MIWIMLAHWIGDFLCQSNWMAANKSKNLLALLSHVGVYMIPILCLALFLNLQTAVLFTLVNGILHFVVDSFTSRWTAWFWANKKTKEFFCMIGFDQWLHFTCLFLTAQYFGLL